MSELVLDASYALTWCFPDRATPNTDECLLRMESHEDTAVVPWFWQLEVGNALGKAVARKKMTLDRALAIWEELQLLPIRPLPEIDIGTLLQLAVENKLSIYDASYLQAALERGLPLATNDQALTQAAEGRGVDVLTP